MSILLAGDIGGTKTILRLVKSEYLPDGNKLPLQTTLYEDIYLSQEFSDLVPIVAQFLQEASQKLEQTITIENACFGIAGPVVNNTSELTNLSWSLAGDRLQQELSLCQVTLINDFTAIGYGILGLTANDLCTLQAVKPEPLAPIAVLGAGTGLGEGFLVPLPDGRYRICPSEGSHADFAPRSPIEFELLTYLRETYHLERVSVERVVSGLGIASIYQFLRDRNPLIESNALGEIYHTWKNEQGKGGKTVDLSAEVSHAAVYKNDPLSRQTMELFIEAYGAEAGNLALKLLPYGGLYVAGGIAAKILPLMQQGNFLKAFQNKGRVSPLLEQIPIHIILNPNVGLMGAALRAAR